MSKYQFAPKELHEIQEEINSILINRPLFEAGVKSFPDKFPHLPQKKQKRYHRTYSNGVYNFKVCQRLNTTFCNGT